jgi:hypothetical protein
VTLLDRQWRVLELEYPSIAGPYVGDVLLSVIREVHNLLPRDRELTLPAAMPLRFGFPPRVALKLAFVSPVPHTKAAALCDHGALAHRTGGREAGLRFLSFSIDEGELHQELTVVQEKGSLCARGSIALQ